MAKVTSKYETYNPYKASSSDELNNIRRTLAKRANQRLVRLERAYSYITGESYASYGAASYAYDYLRSKGRNRFSESRTYTNDFNVLRREILELQRFLGAVTSTVAGQRAVEQRRVHTFEEKGIKFAGNKEFYDFLNSKLFDDLSKTFDSNKIVEIYDLGRQKLSKEEVINNITDVLERLRQQDKYNLKELKEGLNLL